VSRWLYWFNNRKQSFCLLNTIYSTYVERLDYYTRQLRKESDESNKHEQSCKPSESVESTSSSATCTRASSRTTARATATGSSKGRSSSFTGNSLVRKHKYTTITTSRECANDILNREYAEYLASTSAGREDVSTGVRVSDEPRNFKPTDADTRDSIERCIGIPAGVTV
jgi:hypothetical protein